MVNDMAQRRMFAKTIVESDAFTSMSLQAQLLYFHLAMSADDDGLLNNAAGLARNYGIRKAALKELFDNRFLLDLGNSVTCIKHWKICNEIKKDRYKPTIYQKQLESVIVRKDGAYTEACKV